MVFSSPLFLFVFLPLAILGSLAFRRAGKNAFLLALSLLFYTWGEVQWAPLLAGSIVFNYVCGLWIAAASRKKAVLATAVVVNLAALGVFKYANFVVDNVGVLLGAVNLAAPSLGRVHLPIGISFYTFHAISYLVDVYRKKAVPQRSLVDFALYVSLFPQLVAGPIVRYHEIEAQLRDRGVTLPEFASGIRRFVVGLAKKVLVANTLAVQVDAIFAIPGEDLTCPLAWLGAALYTLQIYFDFSAYSDMAIGLGHLFGFTLPENFDYPYTATSITDFWRRWHQSLSRFFRDYVYVPLGGNRQGAFKTYRNLLVVFFLCGLWHGASWNFVVWGLYHGAFLVLERRGLGRLLVRVPAVVRHAYAVVVVLVGWVFFRADTLGHAVDHLHRMVSPGSGELLRYPTSLYLPNDTRLALVVAVLGSAPLLPWLGRFIDGKVQGRTVLHAVPRFLELAALLVLLVVSAAWLASGTYNPFIYFRF